MEDREGFLARWFRIGRQKVAAKARAADDPAETIDLLLQNQMAAIARGRADLVIVTSAEKRLQSLLDEYRARVAKYEESARSALAAGRADLAATNVRRQIECEALLAEGTANVEGVRAQRAELNELLEQMRAQYDRLRMRRETVRALVSGAQASASSQESLTAAGDVGRERERGLEAARETLARLQARSNALAELRAAGSLDAVGAGEFDGRVISDSDVQRRLTALQPPQAP
jgi:phage shock protein A